MPELPEVETTLRGIKPYLIGHKITEVVVRNKNLRWPVPRKVSSLGGSKFNGIKRRGKYLIVDLDRGSLIIHLGMSGSLRIVDQGTDYRKHDHVDFSLDSGKTLRFHDPRRFGCVLFCEGDPLGHKLLSHLGPEPLSENFSGQYLYDKSRGRKVSIKQFVMNSKLVVGVGNIYACEALFFAGINPRKSASRISLPRYEKLVESIRGVLNESIRLGGTTLRDFVNQDGEPGYFQQILMVYGREGDPCKGCGNQIRRVDQSGRSTFYCTKCQK